MNYLVIKTKKMKRKIKIETPKLIWIDEFVSLRSKMCSFECGDDNKNKLQGVSKSQSKHIKFEDYKICIDGKSYLEERKNNIIRSVNHEMYRQQIKIQHYIFSMINDVI